MGRRWRHRPKPGRADADAEFGEGGPVDPEVLHVVVRDLDELRLDHHLVRGAVELLDDGLDAGEPRRALGDDQAVAAGIDHDLAARAGIDQRRDRGQEVRGFGGVEHEDVGRDGLLSEELVAEDLDDLLGEVKDSVDFESTNPLFIAALMPFTLYEIIFIMFSDYR